MWQHQTAVCIFRLCCWADLFLWDVKMWRAVETRWRSDTPIRISRHSTQEESTCRRRPRRRRPQVTLTRSRLTVLVPALTFKAWRLWRLRNCISDKARLTHTLVISWRDVSGKPGSCESLAFFSESQQIINFDQQIKFSFCGFVLIFNVCVTLTPGDYHERSRWLNIPQSLIIKACLCLVVFVTHCYGWRWQRCTYKLSEQQECERSTRTRDDLSIAAAASIRTCEVSRACCERRCSRCDVTAADSQMFQTDTLLEATAPTVTSSAPTHCSVYFYHATPEVQRKTAMSPVEHATTNTASVKSRRRHH